MPHFIVFLEIFTFLAGVLFCFEVHRAGRASADPVVRPIFYYFIFSTSIIFIQLLQSYFNINIEHLKSDIPSILWNAIFYILLWSLFFALNKVASLLLGRRTPSHVFPIVLTVALIWGFIHIAGIVTYSFTTSYVHLCPGVALHLLPLLFCIVLLAYSLRTALVLEREAKRARAILFGLLLIGYAIYGMFSLITFYEDLIPSLAQLLIMVTLFGWFKKFHSKRLDPVLPYAKENLVEVIGTAYDISKREKDVLALLIEGKSNKEIEQSLFIAASTIKNHVSALYAKLGINSRGQLMNLVLKMRKKER